jgi:diguanylate cyclase (GGDEF)-like protein
MELFALAERVARLEADLNAACGASRLHALAALAWHLRERDTRRALALADEGHFLLASATLPEAEHQAVAARLHCTEGEARRLLGELDSAQELADRALALAGALNDGIGCSDAHWVMAGIASDRGDPTGRDAHLEKVSLHAHAAGDSMRASVAEAAIARFSVFRDARAAKARWGARFGGDLTQLHPGLRMWINDFHGLVAFQSSDFGRAIGYFMQSFDHGLATGQLVRAIIAATNIANSFTNLNEHHAALEWSQRALDLARPTAWPGSIGGCLMQTAEALRHLGRLDASEALLRESLDILQPLTGSRDYAIAIEYLGDVALDRGNYFTAQEIFSQLAEQAQALAHTEFLIASYRGQAHALSHLDRPAESLAAALQALALAEQERDMRGQIATLRVLAQIHARHALPPPAAMSEESPALHYLHRALQVAGNIDGYTVPGDLLSALAQEYAKAGRHAQAYEAMVRAQAAREKTHSQEATNRAIAMQVQQQTERERAEAEHHRQLAAAEARRAQVLQQTNATLERLGAVGQEITTHLDAAAVFRTMDRHVHGLLDANHFSIYLFDADNETLSLAFGVEAAKPMPARKIALSSPTSNSARCVRERREILVDYTEDSDYPNLIPGTRPMLSQLFWPLIVGERVLGVMTIQSPYRHAYGEREQLIFRTLCAYGAIALDNAAAYRELKAALKQLNDTKAQLEEASVTDALTGLRNRRFLLQHVESDVAMTLRRYDEWLKSGMPAPEANADMVFFMVDLDHFKAVNDTYGHAAGDLVLVQMRQRLREVFRDADHIIRWGGEEFLVIARGTSRADAPLLAERVRHAVAASAFELADGVTLAKTCSIGFACFPFVPRQPRLLSWSQVVELADQCLYMAKRAGRDAWVGMHASGALQPAGFFEHLMADLERAVRTGDVQLVQREGVALLAEEVIRNARA